MSTYNFADIIPNMAKHIYINDTKPENKNFYIVDLSRDKCKYHNGQKWIVGKTNEKIGKLFDNVHNVLTESFDKSNIAKTIKYIKKNPTKFSENFINLARGYLDDLYNKDDKDSVENKEKIINNLKLIFLIIKKKSLKLNLIQCQKLIII